MGATYKTLAGPAGPSEFKDRGSKFLGYGFPVHSEADVKRLVEQIRRAHHKARHWCYAWRIGPEPAAERANDDGEPARSAGQPILQQIRARELTDTLVVVVRYFGGVKLGVGGLIRAYKAAASKVLDMAEIMEKPITQRLHIRFDYDRMNTVMKIIKRFGGQIRRQNAGQQVEIEAEFEPEKIEAVKEQLNNWEGVEVK